MCACVHTYMSLYIYIYRLIYIDTYACVLTQTFL